MTLEQLDTQSNLHIIQPVCYTFLGLKDVKCTEWCVKKEHLLMANITVVYVQNGHEFILIQCSMLNIQCERCLNNLLICICFYCFFVDKF